MCEKCGCSQPAKEKKKDPGECSPEQVKECHGDVEKHPCVDRDCEKEKKKGKA